MEKRRDMIMIYLSIGRRKAERREEMERKEKIVALPLSRADKWIMEVARRDFFCGRCG